jgi:hypothetical protein
MAQPGTQRVESKILTLEGLLQSIDPSFQIAHLESIGIHLTPGHQSHTP